MQSVINMITPINDFDEQLSITLVHIDCYFLLRTKNNSLS